MIVQINFPTNLNFEEVKAFGRVKAGKAYFKHCLADTSLSNGSSRLLRSTSVFLFKTFNADKVQNVPQDLVVLPCLAMTQTRIPGAKTLSDVLTRLLPGGPAR